MDPVQLEFQVRRKAYTAEVRLFKKCSYISKQMTHEESQSCKLSLTKSKPTLGLTPNDDLCPFSLLGQKRSVDFNVTVINLLSCYGFGWKQVRRQRGLGV